MKGVIFTEFLEMIEDKFGDELVDELIESCELRSGGAYTTVGTYDSNELVALLIRLSECKDLPVPDLLRSFGKHLFGRFSVLYPDFFDEQDSVLEFITKVDGFIHVEVLKLYPEAELPEFVHEFNEDGTVDLTYTSPRRFDALAEGLILGAIEHFGSGRIVETTTLDNGCRFRLVA